MRSCFMRWLVGSATSKLSPAMAHRPTIAGERLGLDKSRCFLLVGIWIGQLAICARPSSKRLQHVRIVRCLVCLLDVVLTRDLFTRVPQLCRCSSHTLGVRQYGPDGLPKRVRRDPVEVNGLPGVAPLFAEAVGVSNGQDAGREDQVEVILADWIGLAPAQHLHGKRWQEVALP